MKYDALYISTDRSFLALFPHEVTVNEWINSQRVDHSQRVDQQI